MPQEAHPAADGLPQLHWGHHKHSTKAEQSTEAAGAVLTPIPPQLCIPFLTPALGQPHSPACLFMKPHQEKAGQLCLCVLSAGLTSGNASAGVTGVP